ncbi:MAG: glycosyltransferase family 2 protein, partial [Cyanobacteria bacterium K_DeepCast_35m_m2_023]|nr:glycosyltransferase family 2 protein [Cyanobacteria bacterium K_DeepCast_35m_m2_023]
MLPEPNNDLTIYIPTYNVVDWAKRFEIPPKVRLIAADNASTDGTPEVLTERGIQVLRHNTNLGRLGNWDFCLRHFISSRANWVNLHMAGD